jgi:hypothetical protein
VPAWATTCEVGGFGMRGVEGAAGALQKRGARFQKRGAPRRLRGLPWGVEVGIARYKVYYASCVASHSECNERPLAAPRGKRCLLRPGIP